MIRDLRAAPPAPPPVASTSLAFARSAITRSNAQGVAPGPQTGKAFTIAVTAPRMVTCKRGVAANLAAQLAAMVAPDGSSVCVVDADADSRDIGARFGVGGPVLLDVAGLPRHSSADDYRGCVTRIDPPGLSVLPLRRVDERLMPLLRTKAASVLDPLRRSFDFLVVDAPVAVGVGGQEWEQTMLGEIDVLLVAVSAEPSAAGGMVRYLSTLAAGRARGGIPPRFAIHVVLTGNEEDNSRVLLTERELDRNLSGISVVGHVPQLWGRKLPDFARGAGLDPSLRDQFERIIDVVTRVHVPEALRPESGMIA